MKRYLHESSYHHSVSHFQHVRSRKRFKRALFALLILLLLAGGAIWLDTVRENNRSANTLPETKPTTLTILPSVKVFTTAYFQFQTPNNWIEIGSESAPNKYVYRKMSKNLIQQELVVYVGINPQTKDATRVLPVNIQSDGSLVAEPLSDHCKEAVPKNAPLDPQAVSYKKVSFVCAPDRVGYMVVVGEVGGTTALGIKRPDGSSKNYFITYRNVMFSPDSLELLEIIRSFQAR